VLVSLLRFVEKVAGRWKQTSKLVSQLSGWPEWSFF
jgi:hypothetical protein